ncbi:DUF6228 family protein [Streptomyces broussonetiae]|uniref:DUF6228 family protein n=1 Tax=Streptomyces broussonetiae TaxID=2686304 RepID=UPI002D809D0D|nr:DUF6228 family protein [Streptomyces broussonetiae]
MSGPKSPSRSTVMADDRCPGGHPHGWPARQRRRTDRSGLLTCPSDRLRPFRHRCGPDGDPWTRLPLLPEPTRPLEDEPTLDFCINARGPWGTIETSVQTWDGDGLDAFLASLADDSRGREGARTWHSLRYDLTLSAQHRPDGHVQLAWGIHDRAPSEQWHFVTNGARGRRGHAQPRRRDPHVHSSRARRSRARPADHGPSQGRTEARAGP